jgi:hypothetical protein
MMDKEFCFLPVDSPVLPVYIFVSVIENHSCPELLKRSYGTHVDNGYELQTKCP